VPACGCPLGSYSHRCVSASDSWEYDMRRESAVADSLACHEGSMRLLDNCSAACRSGGCQVLRNALVAVIGTGRGTIDVFLTSAHQRGFRTTALGPYYGHSMERACQGLRALSLARKHPPVGTTVQSEHSHYDRVCEAKHRDTRKRWSGHMANEAVGRTQMLFGFESGFSADGPHFSILTCTFLTQRLTSTEDRYPCGT